MSRYCELDFLGGVHLRELARSILKTGAMFFPTKFLGSARYALMLFGFGSFAMPSAHAESYLAWQAYSLTSGCGGSYDIKLRPLCGKIFATMEDAAAAIYPLVTDVASDLNDDFTYGTYWYTNTNDVVMDYNQPFSGPPKVSDPRTTTVHVIFNVHATPKNGNPSSDYLGGAPLFGLYPVTVQSGPATLFVTKPPPSNAEPRSCSADGPKISWFPDPINPADGSMFKSEADCGLPSSGLLEFDRFYNSVDPTATNLGSGWRGGYSRRVLLLNQVNLTRPYLAGSPDNSSLYANSNAACTDGFAEIRTGVPAWSNAIAVYEENLCKVKKSAMVIAILPIHTTGAGSVPLPSALGYDVVRDDGQVIHFYIIGGTITGPVGTVLKFKKTPGGYSVTTGSDDVETYDTNGVLLNIVSRAGLTQTMNYDALGRLSEVTNNFGHGFTLNYDAQNRLISVVRQ
jgi:YD repeat-containing protein